MPSLHKTFQKKIFWKPKSKFEKALQEFPAYTDAKDGLKQIEILLPQALLQRTKGAAKVKSGKKLRLLLLFGRTEAQKEIGIRLLKAYRKAIELKKDNSDAQVGLGMPSFTEMLQKKICWKQSGYLNR